MHNFRNKVSLPQAPTYFGDSGGRWKDSGDARFATRAAFPFRGYADSGGRWGRTTKGIPIQFPPGFGDSGGIGGRDWMKRWRTNSENERKNREWRMMADKGGMARRGRNPLEGLEPVWGDKGGMWFKPPPYRHQMADRGRAGYGMDMANYLDNAFGIGDRGGWHPFAKWDKQLGIGDNGVAMKGAKGIDEGKWQKGLDAMMNPYWGDLGGYAKLGDAPAEMWKAVWGDLGGYAKLGDAPAEMWKAVWGDDGGFTHAGRTARPGWHDPPILSPFLG